MRKSAKTQLGKIFIAWAALIVCGCGQELPTRSECIIAYNLIWSVEMDERHDAIEAMFPPQRGFDSIVPLAGVSAPTDRKRLYLQFGKDCAQKENFAEIMIEYWRSKHIKGLPEFYRIPDPIYPSMATIDLRGDSWSDGRYP